MLQLRPPGAEALAEQSCDGVVEPHNILHTTPHCQSPKFTICMSCLILVEQRGQNHLPMSSRPIDIHITEVAPAPTVGPSIIEVPGFNSPRACLENVFLPFLSTIHRRRT